MGAEILPDAGPRRDYPLASAQAAASGSTSLVVPARRFHCLLVALALYCSTGLIVLMAAGFAQDYVKPKQSALVSDREAASFARWDGVWYASIARDGYSYDLQRSSNIAFFPVYPLAGRAVSSLTGWSIEASLLVVSNFCVLVSFWLLILYFLATRGDADLSKEAIHCAFALAIFPTTFFFRMAYSESAFLALSLVAFFGMARRWPLVVLALICGLITATRAVGIAILVPFVWHATLELHGRPLRWLRLGLLTGLSTWGLAVYMLFQYCQFGDALAFAHAQDFWRTRSPGGNKYLALLTLEPIWSLYWPESEAYWRNRAQERDPLFSLRFANPVYFLSFAVLVIFGRIRRWITTPESLFAALLLLIPYVTRSFEMCMASHGRFAAVAFPVYFVLGHLLVKVPSPWNIAVVVPFAFLMAAYAALFASGYTLV
jgi:hypothetical protein